MDTEQNNDKVVSCTVTPAALELIDHYADERKLYRSNWLREAIGEKLEREFAAEKRRHNYAKGVV